MTLRIRIHSQKQVEFALFDLDHAIQIAPLKNTIEHKLFFDCESGVHTFKGAIEQIGLVEAISSQFLLDHIGFNYFAHVDAISLKRLSTLQRGCSFDRLFLCKSIFLMKSEGVNKARAQVMDAVRVRAV